MGLLDRPTSIEMKLALMKDKRLLTLPRHRSKVTEWSKANNVRITEEAVEFLKLAPAAATSLPAGR